MCSQDLHLDRPSGLMVDLLGQPRVVQISNRYPRFTWVFNHRDQDEYQTAWHILVASSLGQIDTDSGDIWDSTKTTGDISTGVPIGVSLSPHKTYYWKVRTWDSSGKASPWSEVQEFRTGQIYSCYQTVCPPLQIAEVKPQRIIQKGGGHFFVDFGRTAFAYLKLALLSRKPDQETEIYLGENTIEPNTVDSHPPGHTRYWKGQVSISQGHNSLEVHPSEHETGKNHMKIRMPGYIGEVMPFRYCELTNCPCELDKSMISQMAVHYPFDEGASSFHCSDDLLNKVWEFCKYSIKATTFMGIYVDGDRERKPYEADAFINQLCHYCLDRDYALARFTHEYLITHPTWPTEWIMHSVLMAWADYLYTGDIRSVEHWYGSLKNKTLHFLAREDGLISTQTDLLSKPRLEDIYASGLQVKDIVDWPSCERDGYEFCPTNTVVNAFHYRALILMGKIAHDLGKDADTGFFLGRADKVKELVNQTLLDRNTGLYIDGEDSRHSSLHANIFPVAFGLAPEGFKSPIAEFIRSKGMACSPYGAQYLLEALFELDQDKYALQLLTSRDERSWWHMFHDVGSSITLEAWDNKYKPNQDWNHAWGASPANIIPRKLMGIEPLKPGFADVLIKPRTAGLKFAKIKVPTIRGPITLTVNDSTEAYEMTLSLPANVWAKVHVPVKEGDHRILVDGGIQKVGVRKGSFVVFDHIGSGEHIFSRK